MELLVEDRIVIIDDCDFEIVKKLNLCFYKRKDKYYVLTSKGHRLHRIILGVTNPKIIVDHINGDTLDNRRSNLRACSQKNNSRNRSKSKGNLTSRHKGVYWNGSWKAQIRVDYKAKYLGTFDSEDDAAIAYNKAAIQYFGDFAKLNTV